MNLINIYQWKKLFHVKFEFLQNVDKTSPVTLVQKGVTGIFKEEDDRLQKKKKKEVKKEIEWACSYRIIFTTYIKQLMKIE